MFHQVLAKTVLGSMVVIPFFTGYVSALLLFFTAVFLFPFGMLGFCVAAACPPILGAKATCDGMLCMWHNPDNCTKCGVLQQYSFND